MINIDRFKKKLSVHTKGKWEYTMHGMNEIQDSGIERERRLKMRVISVIMQECLIAL